MAAARGGMWCALVAGAVAGAFGSVARGQVVGNGCGYEVIETLPDGPTCGFGPYVANILDINDAGTVCGYLTAGFCPNLAFMQEPGGPLVILPAPPGSLGSRADGLNSNGLVVGSYRGSDDVSKPCRWVNGQFEALPIPRNANGGEAAAVNSKGVVAGHWANYNTGPVHACVWVESLLVDLHPGPPFTSSKAFALNDSSEVAGTLLMGAGNDRAFFWSESSGLIVLPPISGGSTSSARAIDSEGSIVGSGIVIPPGQSIAVGRSFYWRNGEMTDLGAPSGITAVSATDVDSSGRIVGRLNPGSRMFVWDMGVIQTVKLNGFAIEGLSPAINDSGLIGDKGQRLRALPRNVADINGNCAVNTDDLIEVIVNWGRMDSPADVNMDGIVDGADVQLVIINWG